MPTLPVIIVLVQIAAAVLFGLGIRAVGTGRRQPTRHGLWIGPVLFLAAPAAAARLTQLSAMDAVFPIAFLVGFFVAVTVTVRRRPTPSVHLTTGDDPS